MTGEAPVPRVMRALGWIATIPGAIGLLGVIVLFSDAVEMFGCQSSPFLRLTCPSGPIGLLPEVLWFSGLVVALWFPATLVPIIFTVGYPIALLAMRRRRAATGAA